VLRGGQKWLDDDLNIIIWVVFHLTSAETQSVHVNSTQWAFHITSAVSWVQVKPALERRRNFKWLCEHLSDFYSVVSICPVSICPPTSRTPTCDGARDRQTDTGPYHIRASIISTTTAKCRITQTTKRSVQNSTKVTPARATNAVGTLKLATFDKLLAVSCKRFNGTRWRDGPTVPIVFT